MCFLTPRLAACRRSIFFLRPESLICLSDANRLLSSWVTPLLSLFTCLINAMMSNLLLPARLKVVLPSLPSVGTFKLRMRSTLCIRDRRLSGCVSQAFWNRCCSSLVKRPFNFWDNSLSFCAFIESAACWSFARRAAAMVAEVTSLIPLPI
jgi:hypothetical protein